MSDYDDWDGWGSESESEGRGGSAFRRRLADQLGALLDPDGPIKRGQGLLGGVTHATKEEVMRLVSQEVRGFLDKIDAADLVRQALEGMVVDVEVRFRRDAEPSVKAVAVRREGSKSAAEAAGDTSDPAGDPDN